MTAPSQNQLERWRRTLAAHSMRDGQCPVCKVPHRCRPWADAFADLLAHGEAPESAAAEAH